MNTATSTPNGKPSAGAVPPRDDRQKEIDRRTVAEITVPSALSTILGGTLVGSTGVKVAFDDFLKEAGSPTDPIERCLVEQYFLGHHRLVRLQAEAATATGIEFVKALNAAAVRLQGEQRRLAMTIRQYRAPIAQKSFAVIGQQNVVTGSGNQKVEYSQSGKASSDQPAADSPKNSFSAQPEVNNNEENLHDLRERIARGEKPEPGSSGPAQHQAEAPVVS